jgi:predicted  nucleic acid-binding Zn-ribbon protein
MNDLELIGRAAAVFIGVAAMLGTIWKLIDVFVSQRNEIQVLKTACNAFVKEIDFRQLQSEHTHLRNTTTEALVTLEESIKKLENSTEKSITDRQHLHHVLENKMVEFQDKMDSRMNKIFDQLSAIKVDIAKISKD